MKPYWHIPALFYCLLILPYRVHAAAWLQQEGHGQFISAFSYYYSDEFYNRRGDREETSAFAKTELSRYIEYGFDDALTIGANPRLAYAQADDGLMLDQFNSSQTSTTNFSHAALNLDLFTRHKLYEEGGLITSVQPLVSIPEMTYNFVEGYHFNTNRYALELRGLLGYSFQWQELLHVEKGQKGYSGQWHFANMELAYRHVGHYAPTIQDELRIDNTLGFRPSEKWLMMAQNFTTLGVSEDGEIGDIGFSKMQLSGIYHANDRHSIQLGVFQDVWGKQSGKGQGIIIGVWAGF